MASIAHLPVELTLNVIEYLRPHVPYMDTDEALMSRDAIVKRSDTGFEFFYDPVEGEDNSGSVLAYPRSELRHAGMVQKRIAYSDLGSLRQVNRYFNALCEPLFYTELDILPQQAAVRRASAVLSRYGDHVRHLRIIVTKERQENSRSDEYERLIEEAVVICRHTTSLYIYYEPPSYNYESTLAYHQFSSRLSSKVVHLATQGSVSSLGIGSLRLLRNGYGPYGAVPLGIQTLLPSLIPLLPHALAIKHLEISCESLTPEVYTSIRSNVTGVHSLTFGGCLDRRSEAIWSFERTSKWAVNTNLTHLRLIHCQSAYPPHILEVVRHFSSLRHLLVTTCGDFSDVRTIPQREGWSREPNALWRQRPSLDVFYIEHMLEWEILAMGTIPTKTVIATSIRPGDLGRSFVTDPDIFPGLTLLRIEDTYVDGDGVPGLSMKGDDVHWKEKILQKRGIAVKRDAKYLITRR